jgi:hypothetical protein
LARHAYAWIASPFETKAAFTHDLVKPMRESLKDHIGISASNPVSLSQRFLSERLPGAGIGPGNLAHLHRFCMMK